MMSLPKSEKIRFAAEAMHWKLTPGAIRSLLETNPPPPQLLFHPITELIWPEWQRIKSEMFFHHSIRSQHRKVLMLQEIACNTRSGIPFPSCIIRELNMCSLSLSYLHLSQFIPVQYIYVPSPSFVYLLFILWWKKH